MQTNRFSISVRIYSSALDASDIERELNLAPTYTQKAGDRAGPRNYVENLWEYESSEAESESFRDSCEHLITFIEKYREKLEKLPTSCRLLLWVGHFVYGPEGSTDLSSGLIDRLAKLRFNIHVGTYFCTEAENESAV